MRSLGPPEEEKKGITDSKLLWAVVMLALVAVMIVCVYVILGTFAPTVVAVPTPTPKPSPTPTPTPCPTPTPTPIITPFISPTPTPVPVVYQFDQRVTTVSGIYPYYNIWDRYILYEEEVAENTNAIYLYDVTTGAESLIAHGAVTSYGAIGENKIALVQDQNFTVTLYDITTHDRWKVSYDDNKVRCWPFMDHQTLLYYQDEGAYNGMLQRWVPKHAILMQPFAESIASVIAPNLTAAPYDFGIGGNYVVWTSQRGSGNDIWLLNLHDGSKRIISPPDSDNTCPRIVENKIIYHRNDGNNDHIWIYYIPSGLSEQLTFEGRQFNLDVFGTKVVYDDDREGNWNIYMRDLATGEERRLTNEPHDQTNPKIFGDRVVYLDNRNGDTDVYTLQIP